MRVCISGTLCGLGLGLALACGSNIYTIIESHDPGEEATIALENNDADRAIKILDEALEKNPTEYKYLSLLASAKALKAGLDLIELTLNLAQQSNDDEEGEGRNPIVSLFGVMPEATEDNITLLSEAVEHMEAIPNESRRSGDHFKLSMFYTTLMTMRTKALDLNGDGVLDASELAAMDETTALAVLTDLAQAEGNVDGSDEEGAANAIGSIRSKIDSQEGSNDTEKLRNFLASSGG